MRFRRGPCPCLESSGLLKVVDGYSIMRDN